MYDIAVDIETTGTRPDRSGIIQIGAVRFDYEAGTVDPNFFDRCLHRFPHRMWDEDTRAFWGKHPGVYASIQAKAEDPKQVFEDFRNWVGTNNEEYVRLWAAPVSFEHSFLESHYYDLGLPNPFHYRYTVDINSWIDGMLRSRDRTENIRTTQVPFEGNVHDALHDCLHALKRIFLVKERVQNGNA